MQKVIMVAGLFVWMLLHISLKPVKSSKDLWQSWSEVTTKLETDNKPLLIDVYTNWCYYCKVMDATTYKNDSVQNYLKSHFYRFKFNAETKDTIVWSNNTFRFNKRYGCHDFAVYLTRGNIVYPTTVIITPGGQPFYQFGQLKPAEMELLLKYYGEEKYKQMPMDKFAQMFKPSWK